MKTLLTSIAFGALTIGTGVATVVHLPKAPAHHYSSQEASQDSPATTATTDPVPAPSDPAPTTDPGTTSGAGTAASPTPTPGRHLVSTGTTYDDAGNAHQTETYVEYGTPSATNENSTKGSPVPTGPPPTPTPAYGGTP